MSTVHLRGLFPAHRTSTSHTLPIYVSILSYIIPCTGGDSSNGHLLWCTRSRPPLPYSAHPFPHARPQSNPSPSPIFSKLKAPRRASDLRISEAPKPPTLAALSVRECLKAKQPRAIHKEARRPIRRNMSPSPLGPLRQPPTSVRRKNPSRLLHLR